MNTLKRHEPEDGWVNLLNIFKGKLIDLSSSEDSNMRPVNTILYNVTFIRLDVDFCYICTRLLHSEDFRLNTPNVVSFGFIRQMPLNCVRTVRFVIAMLLPLRVHYTTTSAPNIPFVNAHDK